MCVVSMIYDHYWDKWNRHHPPYDLLPLPSPQFPPSRGGSGLAPFVTSPITPEEIAEFRKLLERAREYDKKHNEPNCELEEKKARLRKLAEEMGVTISFD